MSLEQKSTVRPGIWTVVAEALREGLIYTALGTEEQS